MQIIITVKRERENLIIFNKHYKSSILMAIKNVWKGTRPGKWVKDYMIPEKLEYIIITINIWV
jgi:hypothetical protein